MNYTESVKAISRLIPAIFPAHGVDEDAPVADTRGCAGVGVTPLLDATRAITSELREERATARVELAGDSTRRRHERLSGLGRQAGWYRGSHDSSRHTEAL